MLGGLIIVIGLLAANKLHVGANRLSDGGIDLIKLRSQNGNTVAEAYYRGIGACVQSTSNVIDGFALGVLTISLAFGARLILTDPRPRNNGRLIYG